MDSYYTIPTNNTGYAWQPTSKTNDNILNENGIMSNWKYRQYIQNNASQIMKYNSMSAIYASGNNPYISNPGQLDSMQTPYLFSSLYNNNLKISNSDLKQNYLEKEQMTARMVAPSINTNMFSAFDYKKMVNK